MVIRYLILLLSFILITSLTVRAYGARDHNYEYIKKYNNLAIKKMQVNGIPASITLAQGILESSAGRSLLAKKANNHFGIKCYDGWSGASIKKDDDKKNECFKKYKSVVESYEDHSYFLKRDRYQHLYKLKKNDYKGWANGLQKAGYATNKSYAKQLISIIERYKLYEFDKIALDNLNNINNKSKQKTLNNNYEIYINNGSKCIIAKGGERINYIAYLFNIDEKRLNNYNDALENKTMNNGDIIYLENKKGKAEKPYFDHKIASGESLHSISQKYGIKIKSLLKLNKFSDNHIIRVGDNIKLR